MAVTPDIDRFSGEENFDRSWEEYKNGFGDVNKEFWIGNQNLHRFTTQGRDKSTLIKLHPNHFVQYPVINNFPNIKYRADIYPCVCLIVFLPLFKVYSI